MRVVLTESISFEGSVFLCPLFSRNCYIYSRRMKGVCKFIWFVNRNISNADISIETYGGLSSFMVFTTQNLPKSKEYLHCSGELRTSVNTMTIDCTWRIRLNHTDRKHSSGSLDEPEYLEVWPDLTSLLRVVILSYTDSLNVQGFGKVYDLRHKSCVTGNNPFTQKEVMMKILPYLLNQYLKCAKLSLDYTQHNGR